jgi:hypothetical protein
MVVIVCGQGDEGLFQSTTARLGVPVTFVLLRETGIPPTTDESGLRRPRLTADLFVTTSDTAYVYELIANLAS